MTPEGKVKAKIKRWFAKTFPTGFTWMPVSNGMGKHGIPDHICCVPVIVTPDMIGQTVGMFVAIEAKATTEDKLSKNQERTIEEIIDAGGIVEVVYGDQESFERMCESIESKLS